MKVETEAKPPAAAKPDTKGKRKAETAEAPAAPTTEEVPAAASPKRGAAKSKKPKAATAADPKSEVKLEDAAPVATKSKPASKKAQAPKQEEADDVQEADKGDDASIQRAAVGSGRTAAQGKAYKEKSGVGRTAKSDYVEIVEEPECETEALALEQTIGRGIKRRYALPSRTPFIEFIVLSSPTYVLAKECPTVTALLRSTLYAFGSCRLIDFCIETEAGQVLNIDRISIAPGPILVSGEILMYLSCPFLKSG